jgi:hypothetical protein
MTFGTDLVSSGHSVLVLKHDLAGDFANVLALGDTLARRMRCDVDLIEAKLRVNLLLPGIWTILALRSRAAAAPDPGQGRRVWRLMFSGRPPGKDRYAAVVSTLGSGEAPAAFVASFWGAPALHLGAPKRLPRRHFSAIVAHPGQPPVPATSSSRLRRPSRRPRAGAADPPMGNRFSELLSAEIRLKSSTATRFREI